MLKRDALGTTSGIRVIVVLAITKRLEQLESTHLIIEMYGFLVHYEMVLKDWRKSRVKIIK